MINELTFEQLVTAIKADGHNITHMITGEPGIGKTSIGRRVADELGYRFVYLDIANMALGDLTLPAADRELGCAKQLPNEILQLHTGEPLVIMADEWTKGSKEVKNMTLPMFLERRLGSIKFHPDSRVFATGNMSSDGVGDSIQAHQRNRFVNVRMRKPSADEWINNFAANAGIHPVVIAFVHQFPQVLQSYLNDPQGENKYIFNPKKAQDAFVAPRSLEFASDALKTKHLKDEATLMAQLVGAIGSVGAGDLMSFVNIDEQLPPFATIVADPTGTAMPANATNRLLLMYNIIHRVEKDTLAAILPFIDRMENELQGLFLNRMLTMESKKAWAAQVPQMASMATRLKHLFG